jgi:hypothetical protein
MTDDAEGVSRRTAIRAMASGPVAARGMFAKAPLEYSIALRPTRALLGDRMVAALSCVARNVTDAVDFGDASLTLEMRCLPKDPDPDQSFPNHFAVQQGTRVVRYSRESHRTLRSGERLERKFDLVAVFPERALDLGDFGVSYETGPAPGGWAQQD